MKNLLYFKKKAGILLLSLCAAVGLCAQNQIVVLEAENADSVHAPAKVKSVDGFSGGKYVGGNDPGSYLFFHDVEMDEAGTYEFKTYFNCNGTRRFTVKVNNYPEVECSVKGTAKWDTPPAETTSVLVYMAAGKNNIKITPYPTTSGGPNLDKFEILETTEAPLPVPHEGFPIVLEAEYAHLSGTLKVKTLEGMSNDRYVGDFNKDTNSALQFTCIDIPEEGPYELKIFTNDPIGRPLDIQTNNYAKIYINVNKSQGGWDQLPTAETSVLVWLDKGLNTISFTESCRNSGPNIDKIEIHETDEPMERPDIEKPYPESCKEIDEYKISFMGSSVCYGTGATNNYGYAYMYADLLEQRAQQGIGRDWIASNISIGGNTTQMVLDRWERDLLRDCGRYVFYGLSLGNERNDGTPSQQAAINYEKGMKQLIRQADSVGIVPVMANNYANAGFNADDYEILKNLNLTIQQWTVPSVNMLGAVDDGSGRWVKAIESDGAHPNSDGHREFSYAIVPSLFDALDAGKEAPERQESTAFELGTAAATQHIEFTPENIVHPFTLSFEVNAASAGTLASFENESGTGRLVVDESGNLVYRSPLGGEIVSTVAFTAGSWHTVSLTHYYAWGMTQLYVDGVHAGQLAEKLVVKHFALGGSAAPAEAQYRQLFFWRSGMNAEELAAVDEGKMLRSSLEIYAPLSAEVPLLNLAQSTNTLSLVDNSTSGIASVKADNLLFSPNPVRQGSRVNAGCTGRFDIYSVNGMLVDSQSLRAEGDTLSTDALAAGTYLVLLEGTAQKGLLIIY